jgi:hypothetical protein
METINKTWGLSWRIVSEDPDYPIIMAYVRKPYFMNGKWNITLNSKFLRENCIFRGIKEIRVMIGDKEIGMRTPTLDELKKKDKKGEFTDQPSMFGTAPLRLYKFSV